MSQPGPYDYRGNEREPFSNHHEGILDQIEGTARSMGDSAGTLAGELTTAVKERPYITLAIAEHRQHGSDDHSGEAPEHGTAPAHGAA